LTDPAEEFERAACEVARLAGVLLRARFEDRASLGVEEKGQHDFVTRADREAEAAIVTFLGERFPEHAVMAEEGSPAAARASYRWVIDPLDGTTNFIHGVPTFAVSIALEDEAGLLAGAVHDPMRGETFHARRGGGARLDGAPIACARPAGLHEALVATGFPFRELSRVAPYLEALEKFMRSTAGLRRAGSASLDLAYTACGRYDGFWEVGLSRWDVAAGALLVREAGGIVTDVSGGAGYLDSGDIVAAGPEVHAALVAVTRAAFGGD
jgi:myo-inositol-1(or 4)-monophosphatase